VSRFSTIRHPSGKAVKARDQVAIAGVVRAAASIVFVTEPAGQDGPRPPRETFARDLLDLDRAKAGPNELDVPVGPKTV